MKKIIIEVILKNDNMNYTDFSKKLKEANISENFGISQITLPAYYFRQEFLDHITEHGLSSLFNFTFSMEDITSPSMLIDEIEVVISKFLASLKGAKRLLIIDPYFFAKSTKIDVSALFSRLLMQISSDLEEICFITNGKKNDEKNKILADLDKKIKVYNVTTDEFHDRYWIDPDNNKGILMGTSLNGLGNKISLIDHLKERDIIEIAKLAEENGAWS